MSRIRTVVVAIALSLFSGVIVTGLIVALAGRVPLVPTASAPSASSGESAARSASLDGVARADPTHERPTTTPPEAPPPTGPQGPSEGGTDDGGSTTDGGTDGGVIIPPLPAITPPPFGAAAEITWLGATPYPATCGGSFTIFADVWDDVGVVSAIAYLDGVGYPMSTNTGANWYVVVPVPAGAEQVGGVSFSVDIRDGDGMGMWSSSQVNVTC